MGLACGMRHPGYRDWGCSVTDDGIDLSKVIQQLRYDIEKTWWEGQQSAVAMEVGPVELEVSVAVEQNADAKLGVKFYVINASSGIKGTATDTQRIKIVLTPRDRRSPTGPLLIGATAEEDDDIPTVSGPGG
jgi:NTP-dependent ternary system trypsin peptidase co-occuring protein